MTTTRERAINLRDWEVRAIRAGRLKLLVRPMKPQPNNPEVFGVSPIWGSCVPTEDTPGVRSGSIPAECVGRYTIHAATNENGRRLDRWIACPYGQPGDRLWVRETWQSVPFGPHRDWPGCPDLRPQKPSEWNRTAVVIWRADGEMPGPEIWSPSIHMPRWASRITLEITGVRVERLQDISEDDAAAEGVGPGYVPNSLGSTTCVGCRPMFARVWRDINGPDSWAANPWVWVIEFKRIEGGVS